MPNPVYVKNDILLIEDFLTTEETQKLFEFASNPEADWAYQYDYDISEQASQGGRFKEGDPEYDEVVAKKNTFWSDKMLAINFPSLQEELTKRTLAVFDNKYRINQIARIQRQYPGSELKQHHDQGYDLSLQRAVIIYLNDNYEGGEIYFTQHDVRLKPKAGSLITFPGTDDYLHGVSTVQPGETRYVISTFAFNKQGGIKILKVSIIGCGFVGARLVENINGEREEEFWIPQESNGTKIVVSKVLVKDIAKYYDSTPANYTSDINDLLSDDTDLVIDASNNSEISWAKGMLTELAKAGKSVVVLNKPLLTTSTQVFAELEKTYGVKFLIGACISKNSPINVSPNNYLFDGNERFEERGHSSDEVCRAIFEEILYFYNK